MYFVYVAGSDKISIKFVVFLRSKQLVCSSIDAKSNGQWQYSSPSIVDIKTCKSRLSFIVCNKTLLFCNIVSLQNNKKGILQYQLAWSLNLFSKTVFVPNCCFLDKIKLFAESVNNFEVPLVLNRDLLITNGDSSPKKISQASLHTLKTKHWSQLQVENVFNIFGKFEAFFLSILFHFHMPTPIYSSYFSAFSTA